VVFPFVFFKVEGKLGFINIWGYFITEQVYDVWGLCFPLFYQAFVIAPAMLLASSLAVSFPWHEIVWFDCLVAAGGVVLAELFTNSFIVQTAGFMMANLTGVLTWAPIILYTVIAAWRISTKTGPYLSVIPAEQNGCDV
jgi:hypothetical protein